MPVESPALLSVAGLTKRYPSFLLDSVSFELAAGTVMGFVGRNGAGKSTTLKSLFNFVHPDAGEVRFLGMEFASNEAVIKQLASLTFGGVDFYKRKKIAAVTDVYRRFFATWDEAAYRGYLDRFELVEDKRLDQLSQGMRVKYALALALSHGARVLLLDEPTSGLDPVSRDDLLGLFRDLVADGSSGILFSTQIMTDIEKCADTLTYIKQGRVIASSGLDEFLAGYRTVTFPSPQPPPYVAAVLIGGRSGRGTFEALLHSSDAEAVAAAGGSVAEADLESIMIHIERQG